jgi:phage tail-like protein
VTALVAALAAGPKELWLAFDAAVVEPSPAAVTIVALTTPAVSLEPQRVRREDLRLVVTLELEMSPGAEYEVTVSGVVDGQGQPISPPFNRGRFLGFLPPQPPGRHFDLLQMLPRYLLRGDDAEDLRRFVAVIQEVTSLVLSDVDRWTDILDLERAPEPFVDAMLSDLGNPFEFPLDLIGKRRLAARLVDMYRRKGTAAGIEDAIRFFVGVESRVVAFAGDGLTLGDSRLDLDWVLGPSTPWGRYAFDVEAARTLSDEERRQVHGLVRYLRPAHTHFVTLREPEPPTTADEWTLGESELGQEHTRLA